MTHLEFIRAMATIITITFIGALFIYPEAMTILAPFIWGAIGVILVGNIVDIIMEIRDER